MYKSHVLNFKVRGWGLSGTTPSTLYSVKILMFIARNHGTILAIFPYLSPLS